MLGDMHLDIYTLPGLPDWEQVAPSARLIAESIEINLADHVFLFGCNQGAVAAYLSQILPAGQITITDYNFTALEVTRLTLSTNNAPSVDILAEIELPPGYSQKFNVVIIQIPKGRLLARRWLVQAFNALGLNGNLYLVGPNHWGIQSVIKDAQALYGTGRILAYKKGNRVAHFIKRSIEKPVPDWTNAAGIKPHTWMEFSITLEDHSYAIRSLPGIFSCDHLDEGTKMLLDSAQISPGAKVLDAGCGYGIIGLFAAVNGSGIVHLVDNNLLAIAASQETLSLNRINNAHVYLGDLINPVLPDKYDLILSNPPFHTGMAVDYQIAHALIEASHQALNPAGRLIIVANRFIRYDRLIRDIFGNISILAQSGKFHILSGLKSNQEIIKAKK
jgi:16S rRNA (guanine1207-N2)-methyltransferase